MKICTAKAIEFAGCKVLNISVTASGNQPFKIFIKYLLSHPTPGRLDLTLFFSYVSFLSCSRQHA
jgi:hypothetical protein